MFGPAITDAFRQVKQTFDPNALLNPGKIVDTPGFTENLRLSPTTRNREPATYLDFSVEGGIARAAEQCNGQGACRKLDGGMCPSYMVTLDEEHSTRGRANLLRLTFAGVLPPSDLTNERLFEALDLCVECKACKIECPSGVDVAKLKYEALAQRNITRGVPLRARLFGNIATLSRLGSRVSSIANWAARQPHLRRLLQRFGGIDARRLLPAFASESFVAWFNRQPQPLGPEPRGEAAFFVDTFTNYFHPEVGQAAVRVLRALGYRVVLAQGASCCGRPAISKGMLPTAKRMAAQNVRQLLPFARRRVPIIGTEPSCISALREEYPDLLRDEAAQVVSAQTLLLDELIAKLAKEDATLSELFKPTESREVLVHTHCHQKAIAGVEPTITALKLIPGLDVRPIDSGCCGMAGAFGFEAEHYEVSRAMGALRLFPAVESATTESGIVITGVSCRQQIAHFTSRRPRHSVEILAEALRD
jgi:Fe-S oxidoreductase